MDVQNLGAFKLKIITLPNNIYNTFFYLSQSDVPRSANFHDIVALELRYGADFERFFYTSLGPFVPSISTGFIGVNALVAQELGITDGDDIFVSLCSANAVSVVNVRPHSHDDYNILANMQNIMANGMLHQIRIVAAKQPIPLKMGNISVHLVVDSMKPQGVYGRLEESTEVVVLDVGTSKNDEFAVSTNLLNETTSLSGLIWNLYSWSARIWNGPPTKEEQETQEKPRNPHELLEKVLKTKPKPNHFRVIPDDLEIDTAITNFSFATNPETCLVTRIPERTNLQDGSKVNNDSAKEALVDVSTLSNDSKEAEIRISKELVKTMGLDVGSRVVLTSSKMEKPPKEATATEATAKSDYHLDTVETPFLWESIDKVAKQIETATTCAITLKHDSNSLIIGPPGSGKSTLLKSVARNFRNQNWFTSTVSCKTLRGKKVKSLLEVLIRKWSECAYKEPSVLLLDDLDALMTARMDEDPEGLLTAYCNRVADLLSELSENFCKRNRICLIATTTTIDSLGTALSCTRGPRLFSNVISIPEMTIDERKQMLTHLGINIDESMAEKTHGYRIQDLVDLVSRAKLNAIVNNRETVDKNDVALAMEQTPPMALQGVQVKVGVTYTWADVGGMEPIKSILDEIFRWPSQYPEIFKSCPLKLQTGALLYGPPGCGKTFIAGALANECGMNFKTVKGPELLSKFVGQSEAGVRNLFESARQASPCLLFFDELDSLAPRRGADSTGVTDRVVNQLLTELDGVEGRSGVWVLAASSRPDLIDPALLRPGRIDRAVYCPLPDAGERHRILEVLSRSVKLEEVKLLEEMAEKTEGFTGADLQALLYNSQMNAIQEYPEDIDEEKIVITEDHLQKALASTSSSLSKAEKTKYDRIHERFKSSTTKKSAALEVDPRKQKVTFA